MKPTRYILSIIVLLSLSINVFSQTAIQKIKVNGILDEWPNLLENKSTGSYYDCFNDQKNLYIALKFTDDTYIKKVIAGGLTLSINTTGKRTINGAYQITLSSIEDYRITKQFTSTPTKIDSATQAHRRQVLTKVKELQLEGFSKIPDSVISIYNTYGIKIGTKADESGSLNYELAIPLEQLNLSAGVKTDLAINIQFNAPSNKVARQINNNGNGGAVRMGGRQGGGGNRGGGSPQVSGNRNSSGGSNNDLLIYTSNDFWDKYKMH